MTDQGLDNILIQLKHEIEAHNEKAQKDWDKKHKKKDEESGEESEASDEGPRKRRDKNKNGPDFEQC